MKVLSVLLALSLVAFAYCEENIDMEDSLTDEMELDTGTRAKRSSFNLHYPGNFGFNKGLNSRYQFGSGKFNPKFNNFGGKFGSNFGGKFGGKLGGKFGGKFGFNNRFQGGFKGGNSKFFGSRFGNKFVGNKKFVPHIGFKKHFGHL